jgi:hypothetical protein
MLVGERLTLTAWSYGKEHSCEGPATGARWTSSNTYVARLDRADGCRVVVEAVAPGESRVRAEHDTVLGEIKSENETEILWEGTHNPRLGPLSQKSRDATLERVVQRWVEEKKVKDDVIRVVVHDPQGPPPRPHLLVLEIGESQ